MKKLTSICTILICATSLNAQISLWCTGTTHYSLDSGKTYVDSTYANVLYQFNYDEIDSITIAEERGYGITALALQLWKNNERVYIGDTIFHNIPFLPIKTPEYAELIKDYSWAPAAIDSITWHPYSLVNIETPNAVTLPVVTLYNEEKKTYIYDVYPKPKYATFSYKLTILDPTVVDAKIKKNSYNYAQSGLGRQYMTLTVTPLKIGKTAVIMTFDNKITKVFEVTVTDRPAINDETSISEDSLYNKIYSRLTQTGNGSPNEISDINDIDIGETGFFRGYVTLQESGADHLYWIWNDVGMYELTQNSVTADNEISKAFFRRLYYNIWLCNSYLNRTKGQTNLTTKRAEVRFLRAYFYYYLLDMFGNVPIITDNASFLTTPQSTRAELYQFVESELMAAENDLPNVGQKEDYYRVDKAAAWLLLSRLYINSEVYSGTADYNKAAQYAYQVINSSYDLATHYKWIFMGDNDNQSKVNNAYKEIILAGRQDGKDRRSYAGSIYAVAAFSDNSSMPSTGITDSWKCYTSRAQLPALFFADPSAITEGTADDVTSAAKDDRARFCVSYNGNQWKYNHLNGCCDFFGGWAIQKWSNLMADSSYVQSSPQWPETDIPFMRKAEAYLNYAEALLRGATPINNLSAIEAVNTLRSRANATLFENITLDEILNERGREFYAEGYRRTDLIRFGKFGGDTYYQWEMKRGGHYGRDFPEYMNLYPIPSLFLPAIPQGVQNEGY